jgi:U3 small nucleolar RNA-associated protein 6
MILSLEGAAFRAEELEAAKFFTTAEVRCMFRKRARFEYLLGRRGVPLAKYIQCIRFELGVINLLAIRKVLQNTIFTKLNFTTYFSQEQQPPVEMNQCSITRGLNRRVHLLYQRALRKFRGNVGIWLEFAAYCYANGNEALMSEVISHALQLNPTCAGLWSFSAFWEFKRMASIH